MLGEQRM